MRVNLQPVLTTTPLTGNQVTLSLGTIGYFVPPGSLSFQLPSLTIDLSQGSFSVPLDTATSPLSSDSISLSLGIIGINSNTDASRPLVGTSSSLGIGSILSAPSTTIVGELAVLSVGNLIASSDQSFALFLVGQQSIVSVGNISVPILIPPAPIMPTSTGVDIGMRPITYVGFSDTIELGECYQDESAGAIGFVFLQGDMATARNLADYHGWVTFWYRNEDVHLVRAGWIDGSRGALMYVPTGDEFYKAGTVYFQATISSKSVSEVLDLAYFKESSQVFRRRVMAAA